MYLFRYLLYKYVVNSLLLSALRKQHLGLSEYRLWSRLVAVATDNNSPQCIA